MLHGGKKIIIMNNIWNTCIGAQFIEPLACKGMQTLWTMSIFMLHIQHLLPFLYSHPFFLLDLLNFNDFLSVADLLLHVKGKDNLMTDIVIPVLNVRDIHVLSHSMMMCTGGECVCDEQEPMRSKPTSERGWLECLRVTKVYTWSSTHLRLVDHWAVLQRAEVSCVTCYWGLTPRPLKWNVNTPTPTHPYFNPLTNADMKHCAINHKTYNQQATVNEKQLMISDLLATTKWKWYCCRWRLHVTRNQKGQHRSRK